MLVINRKPFPVEVQSSDGDSVLIPAGSKPVAVADKFDWKIDPASIKVVSEPVVSAPVKAAVSSIPSSVYEGEKQETLLSRETKNGNGPKVKVTNVLKG